VCRAPFPPSLLASQPAASETAPLYSAPNGVKLAVIVGVSIHVRLGVGEVHERGSNAEFLPLLEREALAACAGRRCGCQLLGWERVELGGRARGIMG
jgi:hypothetical protein